MSLHSYTRVWLHIIWATFKREKLLQNKGVRLKVSKYLFNYTREKNIYMKINHVNSEHVHALINLPTNITMENLVKYLKGSSSHWINQNNMISGKFSWGRGYAIFSVSQSNLKEDTNYIANQQNHHRLKTFSDEYHILLKKHHLVEYKAE